MRVGTIELTETKPISEVAGGFTYFRNGDVVVAKITPCFENGKGAIVRKLVNGIGFGTTELHVLRPNEDLHPEFLYYIIHSELFRETGTALMVGAAGQKRIPTDFVADFEIGIPELDEQRFIANFLDSETATIDTLITKKRELIKRLQEKRTALISHAVTKGLDPSAGMQDSGVEWLGEIPKHWTRMRLKFLLHNIIDTEHKTAPYYPDGEYLVVRTSNVRNGKLRLNDARYTDKEGYIEWTKRGIPKSGDILFTREAPPGEACLVPKGIQLCMGQRMVLFRVNRVVLNGAYGVYAIYGGIASEFINSLSQGSTVDHFNMSDIATIPLLTPPMDEQVQISEYLQQKMQESDLLIGKIELAIERLQEYRTALISAAVTGKIDVRNHVQGGP